MKPMLPLRSWRWIPTNLMAKALLESGADLAPAMARIESDLKAFEALRQPYLLYP